jgi:hypothetical protein
VRDAVAARADGGRLRLRRRRGHPGGHQGVRGPRSLLPLRNHCRHRAEHRRRPGTLCPIPPPFFCYMLACFLSLRFGREQGMDDPVVL